MQASAPLLNSQNLCDYCHIKPKFGQYNYCSKTCAGQAPSKAGGAGNALGLNFNLPNNAKPTATAKPRVPPANNNSTLCDYCKKTPKHPGYDYCGKSCAQNAKAGVNTNPAAANQPASKVAATQTSTTSSANSQPKSSNLNGLNLNLKSPAVNAIVAQAAQAAAAALAGNTASNLDPTQIANLVVQQLQSFLPPMSTIPAAMSSNPKATSQATGSFNTNGSTKLGSGQPITNLRVQTQSQEPDEPIECLIPGCNQPVYVDATGQKQSAYCSMRHRQEAVESGLASPCIFCLQLPQSETDYFCSKECREESMNKESFHDTIEESL
ncbi:hypothetical protein GYMLUDRAFT_55515 [Collybiopsis luxurians FD-317 M1]|nr:hypothetical protein GYMLUDRAFT_55515 [Collybiopsis luxurians FD-317 M1]